MSWQPTLSWENAKERMKILQSIRSFFISRDVIEVETPQLARNTTTDVHLEAFTCNYKFLSDSCDEKLTPLYLQTSPEFAMKRLIAAGYGSIFQICKAFRHEEYGRFHNPEFTILEWYRLGFDHFELMDEVAELLIVTLQCEQPEKMTYQDAFLNFVSIDPLTASRDELIKIIKDNGKLSNWLEVESNVDTLLQYVFCEIIEPCIGQKVPCFVYDFPSSQASLAQLSEADPRVAYRFECYFKGVELVNGFNELTDATQQLARFNLDNERRKENGLVEKPIDRNFLAALNSGLPQCSGVALGIDRLLMLALGLEHIEQVMSFTVENG